MRKGILLLLFGVLLLPTHTVAEITTEDDGSYTLLMMSTQWQIDVYDYIAMVNDGMEPLELRSSNWQDYKIEEEIRLTKGVNLTIIAVSRDVQHGLQSDELGFTVALNIPTKGDEYGNATIIKTQLPDDDLEVTIFCTIFCGLGHEEMILTIIVGSPRSGPLPALELTSTWVPILGGLGVVAIVHIQKIRSKSEEV